MSVVQFDLAQWSVWAPSFLSPSGTPPLPSVEFLPAMQRRRLSGLARICFHVCWQVIPADEPCGLVFCSRHGETQRTLDMLQDIQRHEPVSPTAFSHSVHNAIPALLSIARRDITEQVTIAQQGQDGLAAAFLEAALMLGNGGIQQAVIICCDEPLPGIYHPYEHRHAPHAWATAFRLQAGTRWHLSGSATTAATEDQAYTPAPLQFVEALDRGAQEFTLQDQQQRWHWKRHA